MKTAQFVASGVAMAALSLLWCAKDYNPFENYSNASALIKTDACSKRIRNGDTLTIFTPETLAVYTAVREKIDSFEVTAAQNRYFDDTVLKPPFNANGYFFALSFTDTGRAFVNVTTYRSNNTSVSLPSPFSPYVNSPLKQQDIKAVLGSACTLSTSAVGDANIFYKWAFGKDTVISTENIVVNPGLAGVAVGKTLIGSLWVSADLWSDSVCSPITQFSYLFYAPAPPRIKCTTKGLKGDTVITGDTTLTFTFQVLDSSGQGLASVELVGDTVSTADNVTFWKTFVSIKQYAKPAPPKVEIIKATNNLNQVTIDTFYLFYEPTGPHNDLVKFHLINPASPFMVTRLDTVLYIVDVDNYSQNAVTVSSIFKTQGGAPLGIGKDTTFSDSVHRCVWLVPLGANQVAASGVFDTIRTVASIPDRNYSADTTLIVQRSSLLSDNTAPLILDVLVNGKTYNFSAGFDTVAALTATIKVFAIDNETGIKSVSLIDSTVIGIGPRLPTVTVLTNQGLGWWATSSAVSFGLKKSLSLTIAAANNASGVTTRHISLIKK